MKQLVVKNKLGKLRNFTKTHMADSHCHLFELKHEDIKSALVTGVEVMVTNGVNTKSNIETLNMIDGKNVFGMIGVHPEFALKMDDEEIDFNESMIKNNSFKISGVGEIGLDYTLAKNEKDRRKQKRVFIRMLDIAASLKKPVSIHSRESLSEIFSILKSYDDLQIHLHFFEGNKDETEYAERKGYYISVPYLKSVKRMIAIKTINIRNIMAETDSPTASAKPSDVYYSIKLIADSKGLDFDFVAETTFNNTRTFFNIDFKRFMR